MIFLTSVPLSEENSAPVAGFSCDWAYSYYAQYTCASSLQRTRSFLSVSKPGIKTFNNGNGEPLVRVAESLQDLSCVQEVDTDTNVFIV